MTLEEIPEASYGMSDLLLMLRNRWKMIMGIILMFLLLGCLLSLRARKFQANGSLWIQPGTESLYRTSPSVSPEGEAGDKIASETRILQSRTLYLRVADELDLYHHPDFVGAVKRNAYGTPDLLTRDKMYRLMTNSITVSHNPKDQLVEIAAVTRSPALSAKIVNGVINDYIDQIFQMHYGATQRTSAWLDAQLNTMRQKVEKDQETLSSLQSKLGIVGTDPKNSDFLLAQSLNAYTKAEGDATIDRIVAEAKYRYLEESNPDLLEGGQQILGPRNTPNTAQGTLIEQLRSSQAAAAASYAHLLAQYGHNYPDVKQAKAELDEIGLQVKTEQKRILNQSKLAYLAAGANQKMTTDALNQKRIEVKGLQGDMSAYALLQHQSDSDRTLYEGLVQRLQEAKITSGLASSEVDVVDIAEVPSVPEPPGSATYLLGSLLIGCIAGCASAFILEALDESVDGAEAERLLQIPLLAVLPHLQKKFIFSQLPELSLAAFSDAIASLRASLLLMGDYDLPQVIMITSAERGAGKSTTSRNLAATLAQTGIRTLLIDCDRRRGQVASQFGFENTKGLGEVLAGRQYGEDIVEPVEGEENLFVLTAGSGISTRAPMELGLQKMRDLTEILRKEFRCIVLDVPPLLGPADALFISRLADATIFVSRDHVTTKRELLQMRKRASSIGLQAIGFVHNDVKFTAANYKALYAN